MVRPDDGGIAHLCAVQSAAAVIERLQHQLSYPGQRPAPALPVNRRPSAEILIQIAPLRAGSRNPKNPVEHQTVIGRRPPALTARRNHERVEEPPSPSVIKPRTIVIFQKNALELAFAPFVNPQPLGSRNENFHMLRRKRIIQYNN